MMDDRLSFTQIALLAGYAVAMSAGQVLFKFAALRGSQSSTAVERLLAMAQNKFFASAIALYAALAVLWVWILNFTSLSRASLFVALAFALTPLAGGVLFGEPIPLRLVAGVGFILAGLLCVAG
jgi:drug/metabolite transporter (DMT)-like permease